MRGHGVFTGTVDDSIESCYSMRVAVRIYLLLAPLPSGATTGKSVETKLAVLPALIAMEKDNFANQMFSRNHS